MPQQANPRKSLKSSGTITLAMIVRNGGKNFVSLLQEAQEWVDEIVIGDTGSSDNSVSVAREAQAHILEFPWCDDFAAARNTVLAACTSQWIVILDADEQISRQDWQQLRIWVAEQSLVSPAVAGNVVTRNYLPERHGHRSWQPVPHPDPHAMPAGAPSAGFVATSKVRIFPNRSDIRFSGRILETVEGSLHEAQIPVVDVSWQVHHYGHLQQHPQKKQRYLHLAHLQTAEQPHCAQAWAELADCAIGVQNHRQALVAIERSLLLDPADAKIRLTAGWILQELGQLERADEQLMAVAGIPEVALPVRAEAAHLRAQIAMANDRPLTALPLLLAAIRLLPANGQFHYTLGELNHMLGRGEAALEALTRANELLPNRPEPCLNLTLCWETAENDEKTQAGLQTRTPEPVS